DGQLGLGDGALDEGPVAPLQPVDVHRLVDRDAPEPPEDALAVVLELADLLEGGAEGVAEAVLGELTVAELAEDRAPEGVAVPAVEDRGGGAVAALEALHHRALLVEGHD